MLVSLFLLGFGIGLSAYLQNSDVFLVFAGLTIFWWILIGISKLFGHKTYHQKIRTWGSGEQGKQNGVINNRGKIYR